MKIEREITAYLKEWKKSPRRKPALVRGARQIGKSWAIEEFGRNNYAHVAKFDFDEVPELATVFKTTKEPARIVKELALYVDVPILPGETLIIFDEIQECEEALNSLKYFNEKAPEYHIAAAGSLLGVAVKKKNMKVPVGQLDIFDMYPISFKEFLCAADPKTYAYAKGVDAIAHLPEIVMNKLTSEYRRYLICGGMPEATVAMLEDLGTAAVDKILSDILALYELDFAKYATPLEVVRIKAIWNSLPAQLSKENRKFIFNAIRSGARSKDYEDALTWLEDAGIIYRIFNVSKPSIPLSGYSDAGAFKVYACDTGLLRRLARLDASVVANPVAGYTEFKGAMAENAILQSIMANPAIDKPYYWTSGNKAEVEFIISLGADIIPVEVKAENCVSGRSITVYEDKYHPSIRLRVSMLNLQMSGNLLSCPAPLFDWVTSLIHITKKEYDSNI